VPAALVLAVRAQFGGGDGQPALKVFQDPRLDDAAGGGDRGIQLENVAVTDRVDGKAALPVTPQRASREDRLPVPSG
jgi:hypothetical protein